MRWLRWLGIGALALGVVGAGVYYWEFVDSRMPAGSYQIDFAEVRKLADAVAGEKPSEVRLERLFAIKAPMTGAVAGSGWEEIDLGVYSYQVAYPDHTIVIDTAVDDTSKNDPLFDAAAYARMQTAMVTATNIVLTHEHPDHIGGLIAHPNFAAVLAHTQLTEEQVNQPERMHTLKFPEAALASYQPLTYDRYHALAPGIVLIKAPGHTPGSQMVYVKRADGAELLFIGDIAWRFESIERLAARARYVSDYYLQEDREAVLLELAELKRLHEAEPSLNIIPSHDVPRTEALVKTGVLVQGFK